MGYDMYVVDEKGHKVGREPHHYWRRNIWGGGTQADKLVELGMAEWSAPGYKQARFPERPAHTLEAYEKAMDADDWDYEHPDYAAILFPFLKDRRGSTHGITADKLCDSNDGWWVTKEECQEALDAWEKAGRPDVDDFDTGPIGDTIPFLRVAAEHHGFRVW